MRRAAAALVLLAGCAGPKLFTADLSLIRGYSADLEARDALKPPFSVRFKKDGRELSYVSGREAIAREFDALAPQAVLVDNLEASRGYSPAAFKEQAQAACEADCIDSHYAAVLAGKRGVPFIGGQANEGEELEQVSKAGFTVEDYLGYYAVAMVPVWRREGRLKTQGAAALIERLLKTPRRGVVMDFADFKRWYEDRLNKPFNPSAITPEDTAPLAGPSATFLHKLAREVDTARERSIVSTIERLLNKHERVLVVLSASHLLKERAALTHMLGPGKI